MLHVPTHDAIALIEGGTSHTYAELDHASAAIASALVDSRGDFYEARVAFLADGFDYAATLLGIWRAGGLAVPLCATHPPAEIEFVLRDAFVHTVIATDAMRSRVDAAAASARKPVLSFSEALSHPLVPTASFPDVAAERRAMMIYTSGTTGRPKGVVTSHANVCAQVESLVSAWEWTAHDRLLHVLPLHHVHGIVNALLCPLRVGAVCERLPHFDPLRTWERLSSGDITVFTAVPTIYQRLIDAWERADADVQHAWSTGVRGVRLMMSGSAALPARTLARWNTITGHVLLERYGMTELGMVLSNPLTGTRRAGFVGTPLPGVDVRLVEDSGHLAEPGTPGQIEVRGPGVFLEYWKRPDETTRAFRDGWFTTGDIAIVEDGAYRMLGRRDADIIKTGGYKVSALEIENALREHPSIADCAIVGLEHDEWGEMVAVATELGPGCTLTLEELREWCRARLAPYKIPRALCSVTELPRNALGKVLKHELAALFRSDAARAGIAGPD